MLEAGSSYYNPARVGKGVTDPPAYRVLSTLLLATNALSTLQARYKHAYTHTLSALIFLRFLSRSASVSSSVGRRLSGTENTASACANASACFACTNMRGDGTSLRYVTLRMPSDPPSGPQRATAFHFVSHFQDPPAPGIGGQRLQNQLSSSGRPEPPPSPMLAHAEDSHDICPSDAFKMTRRGRVLTSVNE